MQNKLKNIFFLLFLFYISFPFVFKQNHLLQDLLFFIVYLLIIFTNWSILIRKINFFKPKNMLILSLFILISLYSIMYPFIMGTYDLSFFRGIYFSSFQLIISHLALVLLYIRWYKEEATLVLLAKFYIVASLLYLFSTVFLVLTPGLRSSWLSILYISETDIEHLAKPQYYTRIGIDGFAGFRQTLRFSLAVVLNVYLLITHISTKAKINIVFYFSMFFLLIGTLLYGRIGSVASVLALGIAFLLFLYYQNGLHLFISYLLGLVSLVFILLVGSLLSETINTWFNWAFEIIINLFRTGEATSVSTTALFENMYFLPTIKEFFVGEAYFTDPITGSYFGSTDVGFLRSLLFFGIFPTLLNYFIPLLIIFFMFNNLLKNNGKAAHVLLFCLLFLFIVFEIKGGIYHYLIPYLLPYYFVTEYENNGFIRK
ncbi:hypothetical protein [Lacticigenium naphthae]|uniref:hypothetical protein n=1 Tax=Lacticigenium naphthae TaxID=515351 RepID=UPI0003F60637|nr:hypothetical protein [Lacticigenium naphthae]